MFPSKSDKLVNKLHDFYFPGTFYSESTLHNMPCSGKILNDFRFQTIFSHTLAPAEIAYNFNAYIHVSFSRYSHPPADSLGE